MALIFDVASDSNHPVCYPLTVLRALAQAGKLRRFSDRWGKQRDSHQLANALLQDLDNAPPTPMTWTWYMGDRQDGILSWIECDGWAIDTSEGDADRPILIQRASDYRDIAGVTNVRLWRGSPPNVAVSQPQIFIRSPNQTPRRSFANGALRRPVSPDLRVA